MDVSCEIRRILFPLRGFIYKRPTKTEHTLILIQARDRSAFVS